MSAVFGRREGDSGSWRWHTVLQAPHRIAFLAAMVVLAASAAWWAAVQLDRAGAGLGLGYAVSPSLLHAAVMVLGFMPLFFAGFLFTAGPRWLDVPGPRAGELLPALAAQAAGWLLWLAGGHLHLLPAVAGLLLAAVGLGLVTLRFGRMVLASRAEDRMHAKAVAAAHCVGVACLLGAAAALLLQAPAIARGLVLTALWGFVVVVFVSVAHRMIPFFSDGPLPMLQGWRANWMLALMIAVAAFEAAAVWVDMALPASAAWTTLRGALELAVGAVLLRLAVSWHGVKALKARLPAMLHLGFVWLGLSQALGGAAQLARAWTGVPVLPLAALHALTMGCLGSLMLAMVTRVSCGHGGRSQVADHFVWTLFLLLQLAVLARILAAGWNVPWLLPAASLLWAGVMLAWSLRYGAWYGRPRADGRPG